MGAAAHAVCFQPLVLNLLAGAGMDPGLAELQTLLFLQGPFKAAMWSFGVKKQKPSIQLAFVTCGAF